MRWGRIPGRLRPRRRSAVLELPDTPLLRWLRHGLWLVFVALLPVGFIPFLMAAQAHSDGAMTVVALIPVTLVFEHAGEVDLMFMVQAAGEDAMESDDHMDMDMDGDDAMEMETTQ